MPRKTRRAAAIVQAGRPIRMGWPGYLAIALFCAALGAGGAYLAMRPALTAASQSRSAAAQADREQGNQEEDQGQWAQAIGSYQKAIAGGIDNPDIHTDLGVAYFKSNQPQQALAQYQIAQHQNPNHENSLYNEASAYLKLGDSSRAVSVWHTYLQKFPSGQHTADAKKLIAQVQAHSSVLTPPGQAQ